LQVYNRRFNDGEGKRRVIMGFELGNRTLSKVGVIGSGQIGPDIALYFTKVLAPHGVPIVVVDVAEAALENGKAKMTAKVNKGVETGAFKPEQGEAMLGNVTFTTDYNELSGAGLVVEAATEAREIKHKIVAGLEEILAEDCIIASNSSHMEPEVIFENAKHVGRTLVVHYFFPAERNIIVEVVPGADTAAEVADWTMLFYEQIGKVPVQIRSRYGYAVDPVFEGLFLAALRMVDDGIADSKTVDWVCRKALGLGVGPFTAMNLTGGNPITRVGLDHYTTKINSWFSCPDSLAARVESGEPWDVAGRGEKPDVDPELASTITDLIRGAYFGLVGEIVDSGITNIADMELATSVSLVVKPPFAFMNELGVGEALRLIEAYQARYPEFVVPNTVAAQAEIGKPFDIPTVIREDVDDVAVLTIRRPQVLNALNQDVFDQLKAHFLEIKGNDAIRAAVITGFGVKAFVSGADVGMLAALETPEEGEATSQDSQSTLNVIENLGKPVVCAYNGLAFGGGNELALACTDRIARDDLKVLAGQPEPNLGIIPGAGGTQRLPRLIGLDKASQLLRTGRPISAQQGLELGLVSELVPGKELRAAAIRRARGIADGTVSPPQMPREALSDVPEALPTVELGHLSQAIDGIMTEAILEGARLPLEEGLQLESKLFGKCLTTEDMKIGMTTFMEQGPRAKAEFVHR
jgi:enoyl-CoA hydratase/3-hydroxyacyl-CoA dehydrogenase